MWLGGIALALAGFFLIKYSIENSLFTPTMRIISGGLLGGALLYGGDWVRRKPDFSNGIRIAQALSGAGISVLYVSIFAALSLYQLIPNTVGFLGMAAVTVLAVVLSLKHGQGIALLGLVGGFLTPFLVESNNPSAPILFIYLYLVFSGLMIVIKRNNWWLLSLFALFGTFFWVWVWLVHSFKVGDSLWLGLFLIAICMCIITSSRLAYEKERSNEQKEGVGLVSLLNYIGLIGAVVLMAVIVDKADYGLLECSLFALLSVGGITLAYFNTKLYGFVPLTSMLVSIIMLVTWNTPMYVLILTLSFFALLYIGSAYIFIWHSSQPQIWGSLAGLASIAFYLLAYLKLHYVGLVQIVPIAWGAIAFVLAGIAIYALKKTQMHFCDNPYKEYLLAIFTSTATILITTGLIIEVKQEFLTVIFAIEMCILSWINSRMSLKALPYICITLAVCYGILLLQEIEFFSQIISFSEHLVSSDFMFAGNGFLIQSPILHFGVPACMFILTSYFLHCDKDGQLVRVFEFFGIALAVAMGHFLVRHAFHDGFDIVFGKADFLERGIITNILFVFGLVCFFVGRRFDRIAFSWSGIILCAIALFRIIFFDLLILNPLQYHQAINGWFIFNSLLLPYGLPVLWGLISVRELYFIDKKEWGNYVRGFSLFLLFTFISLNVRYLFHGEYLDSKIMTNPEVYSYSVAWLILAVALLIAGIIKHDRSLRYASLGLMILTSAKVFLYDAAELEGLYRVFSFFGLGFSLLGLSWFYTRFVFGNRTMFGNHVKRKKDTEHKSANPSKL